MSNAGTPLAKKLGFKAGQKIKLINTPAYYFDLFDSLPDGLDFEEKIGKPDFIHFFTGSRDELYDMLPELKHNMDVNGMIWVSWPKKASKVPTDVDENVIRELALSIGLVDVKVCAVDQTWSGLKLMIPVKDR